jgi:hypothetical protein
MLLYRFTTVSTRGRPTTNQLRAFGTFQATPSPATPPTSDSMCCAAAMRAAAKAFSHTGAVRGFVFGVAARNLSQVV